MTADAPQTLLQMLRNGRGAGYRGALSPRPDEVIACVVDDPPWDRQVESRDAYYAKLLIELNADIEPLVDRISSADDDAADESPLVAQLLVESLWDCQSEARAIACAAVPLMDLLAAQRLVALGADIFEEAAVRQAAAARGVGRSR